MGRVMVISILAFLSCSSPKPDGTIHFQNNTGQTIDSLIIIANGYPIRFYNVPANKTTSKIVGQGLVKGGHDIKMTPTIYCNGKAIKGQYLYNDLSGFYGEYKIQVDSTFKVSWSMVN